MSGAFVRSVAGTRARPSAAARAVAVFLDGVRRAVRPFVRPAGRVDLALRDSAAWSCRVGRGGATVRCEAGSVWLTREGDAEDRVLGHGEAFRSERHGRIAVLALGAARVVVSGDLRSRRAA
jgi:hypothetical protein